MTRKMFVVYAILALTSCCKNYESNVELKKQIEEFLNTKEIAHNVVKDSRLEEAEKKIQELTNKIHEKDKEKFENKLEKIKDRSEKIQEKENIKQKSETINEKPKKPFQYYKQHYNIDYNRSISVPIPKLSKDNVELGLRSLSSLIDIFSKFEDEFDEIARKGVFLVYELYSHYTLIYKSNMERLENTSNSTIASTLYPITEKIIGVIALIESIEDRSEKIQENIKQKSQNLFKDNLKLGFTYISNFIEIFSKFEDEFGEIAHKGFSLAYDLYEHYTLIYKSNMERLENTSNSTIANILDPINNQINTVIDLVNSNDKNLKISNDLKFDESGISIKTKKYPTLLKLVK